MSILSVMFTYDPESAAKFLAIVFQDLLCSRLVCFLFCFWPGHGVGSDDVCFHFGIRLVFCGVMIGSKPWLYLATFEMKPILSYQISESNCSVTPSLSVLFCIVQGGLLTSVTSIVSRDCSIVEV